MKTDFIKILTVAMAALFLTGCETLENRSDERFRIEATPGRKRGQPMNFRISG
jgi:uncharacterized lipoprotein YajG